MCYLPGLSLPWESGFRNVFLEIYSQVALQLLMNKKVITGYNWGPSGQMQDYAQAGIDSGNTTYLPGSI